MRPDRKGPNLLWHFEGMAGEELHAVEEGSVPASRLHFIKAAIVWIVNLGTTTRSKWKHKLSTDLVCKVQARPLNGPIAETEPL